MAQKSIKELQELDISQLQTMDLKELRKITNNMASAVNKRMRRAEAGGWDRGEAFQKMKESGGSISTADIKAGIKNERQKLIHEFSRGKNFLSMKTSSKRGVEKREKEFQELTGEELGSEGGKEFWEIFRKIEQAAPDLIRRYGSDEAAALLKQERRQNKDASADEHFRTVFNELVNMYESNIPEFDGYEEFDIPF